MESVEEPEEILASGEVSEAGQSVRQWLQFVGKVELWRSQFPSLSLDGKTAVPDGGTDRECASGPIANDWPKPPV